MPIFQFGFMIKHRREELGYTQMIRSFFIILDFMEGRSFNRMT